MDILLIGGTGNISLSVTKQLLERGDRVTLLNRGNHPLPAGAESLIADIRQEEETARKLEGRHFDAVCDFIAFETADVERDRRLFGGKTGQYVFVSTASAYQKPPRDYRITEGVALYNPHWAYSRKKAACEEYLMQQYRENGFPVTVVRPSHTYGPEKVPVGIHGSKGSWQVLRRMLDGKPVLIPGDGTSLWTLTASDDFARGFVGLLGNPRAIGEAFHITSDEALTWDQIHGLIADAGRTSEGVSCGVGLSGGGFPLRSGGGAAGGQGLQRGVRQYQAEAGRSGVPGGDPGLPGNPGGGGKPARRSGPADGGSGI